jgi:hypothetical protein
LAVAGHADAAVADRQGAALAVRYQLDLEQRVGLEQGMILQRLELQLVERVGGVRDELAEEDFLVRVERVDDDVEELTGLGLERQGLRCGIHTCHFTDWLR